MAQNILRWKCSIGSFQAVLDLAGGDSPPFVNDFIGRLRCLKWGILPHAPWDLTHWADWFEGGAVVAAPAVRTRDSAQVASLRGLVLCASASESIEPEAVERLSRMYLIWEGASPPIGIV